ncbi:MAG: response regulator [Elusimicrobia bacterium]|nr:response regulator [Elusimicrobiota bacterium]
MSESTARVVVVEDDPATAQLLTALLEKESYHVSLAMDGQTGLRLAREQRPDLLLLDVLLPGMNGFEVCQRIRQDPATCLIPILLLTSLDQIKDKVTGFKLGADEFVSKPFETAELMARIERTIRRAREALAANPRTGLPGRVALEEEIRRRLAANSAFSVGRLEVWGLGDFNTAYGYDRGDHVIRLAAMIVKSAVVELADRNDVAVHRGGADFGFVAPSARAHVVAARALENAEILLMMQYDSPDRTRNGSDGFSSMCLKAGVVDVAPGVYAHPRAIEDAVRSALVEARQIPGAHLVRRAL